MLRTEIASGKNGRVLLVDSISKVLPEDTGAIVIAGSHGGASSGELALKTPLKLVFFNDAGVGKDKAGLIALDMLQQKSVPSATISYTSGRIGDSRDIWENGIISYVNDAARILGFLPGDKLKNSVTNYIAK
jgi:hypothetical protein